MRFFTLLFIPLLYASCEQEDRSDGRTRDGGPAAAPAVVLTDPGKFETDDFGRLLKAIYEVVEKAPEEVEKGEPVSAQSYDEVLTLLDEERFEELDQFFSELRHSGRLTRRGSNAYVNLLGYLVPQERSEQWFVATRSVHAQAVMIQRETARAWEARGNGYSNTVSEDGWKGFEDYLQVGMAHFQDALSKDATNPAVLLAGTRVALGLGAEPKDVQDMVERSRKSDSPEPRLLNSYLYHCLPRWHGNPELMVKFLEEEATQWSESPAKYAAIISTLSYASSWGEKKELMRRKSTKAVLNRLIEHSDRLWPETSLVASTAANIYLTVRCYDEAIEISRRQLKKLPNDPDLLVCLAWGLRWTTRGEELRRTLDAVDERSLDGIQLCRLARCHNYFDNWSEAGRLSKLALELLTVNDDTERSYCLAYVAGIHDRARDYEKVLPLATEAVTINPRNAVGVYYLGEALYETGSRQDAKKVFLHYLTLRPSDEGYLDNTFPEWRKG